MAEETENCFIVCIRDAKRVTQREVDGVLTEYQQLPHIYINGDYVRTTQVENGYPVYVKIAGDQPTIHDKICLTMGSKGDHWSFKVSADRQLTGAHPSVDMRRSRAFAHIRIPADAGVKVLDDLARRFEHLEIRVPVTWRPKGRNHYETCKDAKVSVQKVAREGVLAHLFDSANTHVFRKQLLDKEVKCGFCMEFKTFRTFLVPNCGHAYCSDCYRRYLASNPNKCCANGCAAQLSIYSRPESHSDFLPLWIYTSDEADGKSSPSSQAPAADPAAAGSAAASGNEYVVRTGAFVHTGAFVCTGAFKWRAV